MLTLQRFGPEEQKLWPGLKTFYPSGNAPLIGYVNTNSEEGRVVVIVHDSGILLFDEEGLQATVELFGHTGAVDFLACLSNTMAGSFWQAVCKHFRLYFSTTV